METNMYVEMIAKVCHEANRALCVAFGDLSQVAWEDAPEWQKESARDGVRKHLAAEMGPDASHNAWLAHKLRDGWRYGQTKDADAKIHPCMVTFEALPPEQQAKDHIFKAIVHALKKQD